MKLMEWAKEKINPDHIITIAVLLFGMLISGMTTYYAVVNTGKNNTTEIEELNARLQNLNQRVKNENKSWDDLIIRLDERYVSQGQFDDFRNSLTIQLRYIREDTQYLRNKLDDR